ncbi:MAG: hypothetical protein IPG89_17770 [Bacteroidetes bacterium]|nr:hypothetical protein [Bacteroidota bacterium]
MNKHSVQNAPFKEHPIIDITHFEPGEYDIIVIDKNQSPNFTIENKFSIQLYCECLLHKLFSLSKSKIKPFIQYQCEQLIDPFTWLNKLEKLIDLNRDLYTNKEQKIKIEKALVIIELIRQEIELNKFNRAARFDFDRLKAKLKHYKTPEEQLSFLYEEQAEYLQNKPKFIDPTSTPFDEKCTIEIEKIERLEQLKKRAPLRDAFFKGKPANNKMVIRGHINILVDAFYQMLHEKKANGLPYLDTSTPDLINFITSNFSDRDGQPLSESTVRTMLAPNRTEKRPKNDNKIQL